VAERIADVERARDAIRRASWREAYDVLRPLGPTDLTPRDLEDLADAAWWLSRSDEALASRQQAYAGYAAAGDDPAAAAVAVRLCFEHFERGEPAVASGWLKRAERHLAEHEECVEHGFLDLALASIAHESGDDRGAIARAEEAARIGRRFGNQSLIALAIHVHGLVLIAQGQVIEGMALLDEAMTSVLAGELTPHFTGILYCSVLEACLDVADLRRAGEWNEAARAWCASLPPEAPFTGLCRVSRAQVADLRGAWSEAEAEALLVSHEQALNPTAAARAFYETGEIRRRIGDVAGAEEAFSRAHGFGLDPQPGSALLRLAQGKRQAALTALRLALADDHGSRLHRARLLAAFVSVALAAGEVDGARRASTELDAIAEAFATPALDATAASARGEVLLARDDVTGALETLHHACAVWQELRLPYETARARMSYSVALRRAGGEEDADLELRAALSTFERLGAAPDAAAVGRLLTDQALPGGLSAREVEVLHLVAAGETNRAIASELGLSEHTVARHLQNIFAKLDVPSRAAAAAFAVEHGLS
jgi:DNA-binding CsgD family transcriptional regulator